MTEEQSHLQRVCIGESVDVLILIMRWPEVWGGGACVGVIGFLG